MISSQFQRHTRTESREREGEFWISKGKPKSMHNLKPRVYFYSVLSSDS